MTTSTKKDLTEKDLHVVRWERLRTKLQTEAIQCHDCRMLRNALILMMDIMIPPVKEIEVMSVPPSNPLSVTAHSEVVIKEPTVRIEEGDGVKVTHENTTKVL